MDCDPLSAKTPPSELRKITTGVAELNSLQPTKITKISPILRPRSSRSVVFLISELCRLVFV